MICFNNKKSAFSLLELFFVLVIMVMLIGVMTGTFQKSYEQSKVARAFSEMDSLINALKGYYGRFGRFPGKIQDGVVSGYTKEILVELKKNGFIPYGEEFVDPWGNNPAETESDSEGYLIIVEVFEDMYENNKLKPNQEISVSSNYLFKKEFPETMLKSMTKEEYFKFLEQNFHLFGKYILLNYSSNIEELALEKEKNNNDSDKNIFNKLNDILNKKPE